MKQHMIQVATALALIASSAVHAQDSVQWKVSDGGNGHWYIGIYSSLHWADAKVYAESLGGHLATTTSQGELDVIRPLINNTLGADYWLGASRASNTTAWNWVTSEPFSFTPWEPGEPDNGPESLCLEVIGRPKSPGFGMWNDEVYYSWGGGNYSIIEFEVDCNSDSIVDYGQCHDGTLPDYNGNNIPDCCERGEACVVSRYPVQWRDDDGGNGHWYGVLGVDPSRSPEEHFALAAARGGHTGTISSTEENAHCFRVMAGSGAVIGLRKQADTNIPEWITGEPMTFLNWYPGEGGNYWERYAALPSAWGGGWLDTDLTERNFSLVEWDADCNNDNLVDYGQILQGQLTDANTNGIPDICEGPTCRDIDLNLNGIVDGGDLGVLLAFWGTVSPAFPRADINGDGLVNGADLGTLLSFWGPCPN
jgi:hypothetical protein